MKCLLCNFQSNESSDVKKHYLELHKVDRNNEFFIKLFKKQNSVFHGKKCLRCNKFLPSRRFKVSYDFWCTMTPIKTCLKESLFITKIFEGYESMRLCLIDIHKITIFTMQKS